MNKDITNIPKQEVKANGAVYAYCLQNLKDNDCHNLTLRGQE